MERASRSIRAIRIIKLCIVFYFFNSMFIQTNTTYEIFKVNPAFVYISRLSHFEFREVFNNFCSSVHPLIQKFTYTGQYSERLISQWSPGDSFPSS